MDVQKELNRQMSILTGNTAEVIPEIGLRDKLEKSIKSGIPLRVKMGIDPTSPDVHLGHMVVYKKIRQFQDLGHKAILIIGDYTARIGDPTGRNAERPPLTEEQVKQNSNTYTSQIFKIVDSDKTEVHFQSSWFDEVTLQEILSASSSFSVAHMLTHDTFRKRLENGTRLSLHEMFYPVLQAWDSIFIQADIELGGTDQKFNILCGRDMQREKRLEPQIVMLMPLLMGIDGRKMSKSLNNHIPVLSTANEKFGRIMSIDDKLLINFFTYATTMTVEDIEMIKTRLHHENPRDVKLELAREIITIYHNSEEAMRCEHEFISVFSKGEAPLEIPEITISEKGLKLTGILKDALIIDSISEGKRLIKQGGLKVDGVRISNPEYILNIEKNKSMIIKAGKRRFLKIKMAIY